MWAYEKKLQYPVNIKNTNPKMAKVIISQLGGPDGELAASMRYLNQRYTAPYPQVKGLLTDIGTEELAHMEIISAILYQLTKNLTPEQIKESGFDAYFVDHTTGIYPASASGVPFTAAYFQSKGDPVTDLVEDLAADDAALLGRPFKEITVTAIHIILNEILPTWREVCFIIYIYTVYNSELKMPLFFSLYRIISHLGASLQADLF